MGIMRSQAMSYGKTRPHLIQDRTESPSSVQTHTRVGPDVMVVAGTTMSGLQA